MKNDTKLEPISWGLSIENHILNFCVGVCAINLDACPKSYDQTLLDEPTCHKMGRQCRHGNYHVKSSGGCPSPVQRCKLTLIIDLIIISDNLK